MSELWKISLHGGHSGDFCEHGSDTLREMLDAAVSYGYTTFGVSAHSPASDAKFIYEEEVQAGLTTNDLAQRFSDYTAACSELADEFSDRIEILRAAEVEIVPESSFAKNADQLRSKYNLDYLIGSVHWVDEIPFDTSQQDFDKAVANRGGLEPFLLRYYELVGEMIVQVKPEVIGHVDLPRLFCEGAPELASDSVMKAVYGVFEKAKAVGCILDLNVSALSKGLVTPYPAPWIVQLATEMGVPFCFGDDSHSVAQVGAGIDAGRAYLLEHGIETITKLTRSGTIAKEIVPLR
jgi:histidinol-phosphatase (PHP family)